MNVSPSMKWSLAWLALIAVQAQAQTPPNGLPPTIGGPSPNLSVPGSLPVVNAPAPIMAAPSPTIVEVDTPTITESMPADGIQYLFPQTDRLSIRGWLNSGFIGNTDGPQSKYNGPYNAVDRANELMFNQGYLILEYGLPTDNSFGIGGRIDMIYGEDFLLAQSAGLERNPAFGLQWNPIYYGLAIPQAYLQLGRKDLNVKVGHFYSPIGYEGLPADVNFFYSKSYSYQFFGPFTHWGALGSWKPTDELEIFAGLTNGWDALDRVNDALGVLAGFKYTPCSQRWWTSFAITTGDDVNNLGGQPDVPNGNSNRTRYSWILDWKVTDRVEYVFHHHLGYQQNGAPGGSAALWYGIDQYLYYTLSDQWKVGGRFEWVRDQDGTRIGLNRPNNPNKLPFIGDAYSLTFGTNWTPHPNLTIRPEIRADWFDGNRRPYNDGTKDTQLMIGLDAILRF